MLPHTSAPASSRLRTSRRQTIALVAGSLGALFASPLAIAEDPFVYGTGVDRKDILSLASPGTKYVATIFVATDCPISNRYLPVLAKLSQQFAPRDVRLWLVYPNPNDTLVAVRRHQSEYPDARLLPQLIAPDARLLAHAHVHVTPEAAIFRADAVMNQPILWHGRIDDRYLTFGTQRPAATRHDLADALSSVLAGHHPVPAPAPPVGCAIIPRTWHNPPTKS